MKNDNKLSQIEAALIRLQEGDLNKPIKASGVGTYHQIMRRLETLRLTMLKYSDKEAETARRNNMAIASVAHDMKTPLAIISGYAECLSDGMDDKDYPALIMEKTEQMNNMVLGLVEESKQARDETNHKMILDSARTYFSAALEHIKSAVEAKGLKLKVKKIPDVQIRIDPYKFGRVVQNLITNAVKYSPAGSTITVSFKYWAKTLRMSVKDQGIGIAKDSIPYIFDQFYTEDKARANHNSNGLGLYITKEIVVAHGGTISVVSKKGRGSKFMVTIPVEPDIEDKLNITGRFNNLPLWAKLITVGLFGWIFCSLYRIVRFFETRNISTLLFGLLCIELFTFVWLIDFLSVCVYKKIAFLSE